MTGQPAIEIMPFEPDGRFPTSVDIEQRPPAAFHFCNCQQSRWINLHLICHRRQGCDRLTVEHVSLLEKLRLEVDFEATWPHEDKVDLNSPFVGISCGVVFKEDRTDEQSAFHCCRPLLLCAAPAI